MLLQQLPWLHTLPTAHGRTRGQLSLVVLRAIGLRLLQLRRPVARLLFSCCCSCGGCCFLLLCEHHVLDGCLQMLLWRGGVQ